MKIYMILLSLAIVFLVQLELSSAADPVCKKKKKKLGKKWKKGKCEPFHNIAIPAPGVGVDHLDKQLDSLSDIKSHYSEKENKLLQNGGVTYESGMKDEKFSQDKDSASCSMKEDTMVDSVGNYYKSQSKRSKINSEDFDKSIHSSYERLKV